MCVVGIKGYYSFEWVIGWVFDVCDYGKYSGCVVFC